MKQPILIGTDFNPEMPRVMEHGARLARALDTHVVLVHAVETIGEPEEGDRETQSFHDELMQRAEEKMEDLRKDWPDDLDLCTLIELGHRVDVLLRLVEERNPLMLVIGTPFRKGPPVGIGLQLLVRCPCPITIVP